jgi:alkaline phosphatase D
VASGDPTPDGVVLWTRLSGTFGAPGVPGGAGVSPGVPGGAGVSPGVPVEWRVSTDPALERVVASGVAPARPEADHTVHVDVTGLEPSTTYWYGFSTGTARSPVGRTRTAPDGPVERLRIGVVCCAHWTAGFFNAYGRLAARDVDLVLHLGDYIYEDDSRKVSPARNHQPPGLVFTLGGYRARYAQYRADPDLLRLHQRHPVVAVWDDHELAGNAYWDGAARHDPRIDGDWVVRREAATRAYREWMPLRLPDPADPLRLWRRVGLGGLCDVLVLDTRLVGRERPAAGRHPVVGLWRRDRSLLGRAQWAWLAEELGGPGPTWRLVASQVVVAPIHLVRVPPALRPLGWLLGSVGGGLVVNPGQWDGYPDEQQRLFRLLADRGGDAVVVSGDLHSSWASELRPESGAPSVAVEFVAPSVSAPSFALALAPKIPRGRRLLEHVIRTQNPHVRFVDTAAHGYVLLDIAPERIEAQWWHVDTVRRQERGERLAATWSVARGDPRLDDRPRHQPRR